MIKGQSSKEAEETIREKLQLPVAKRKLTIEMSEESYQKWIELKGKHVAKCFTDEALFLFMMTEAQKDKTVRQYVRKTAPTNNNNPRFISAQVKRDIFQKAKGQSKGCQSTYALEIDHLRPVAKSGGNHRSNLQLLCRHHNAAKKLLVG